MTGATVTRKATETAACDGVTVWPPNEGPNRTRPPATVSVPTPSSPGCSRHPLRLLRLRPRRRRRRADRRPLVPQRCVRSRSAQSTPQPTSPAKPARSASAAGSRAPTPRPMWTGYEHARARLSLRTNGRAGPRSLRNTTGGRRGAPEGRAPAEVDMGAGVRPWCHRACPARPRPPRGRNRPGRLCQPRPGRRRARLPEDAGSAGRLRVCSYQSAVQDRNRIRDARAGPMSTRHHAAAPDLFRERAPHTNSRLRAASAHLRLCQPPADDAPERLGGVQELVGGRLRLVRLGPP